MRRSQQRGVALIVVLIILVSVTILGLAAMRSGILNLATATNAQVSMLLFRSSDAGVVAIEKKVAEQGEAAVQPGGILAVANMPGAFEEVHCVTTSNATNSGSCYDASATSAPLKFSSGRGSIVVQTSTVSPANARSYITYGKDVSPDNQAAGGSTVLVFATAVMPGLSGTSGTDVATIGGCLSTKPADDSTNPALETVTDCLANAGAVASTSVSEYSYEYGGYETSN